jgi:Tol biopolymer transport system component
MASASPALITPPSPGPTAAIDPAATTSEQQVATTGIVTGGERTPEVLIEAGSVEADAAYSPSFASNGSAVFFHTDGPQGSALKRVDRAVDGAVLHVATILDDGARNYHIQLSPDGETVAFDSDRDGERGVYLARPDGTDVRRVSGEGYAAMPRWSPDGRQLSLLRGERERPRVWNLWLLDLASGELARLTEHKYGQVWGGAWFPDGRQIAYSHEERLIVHELSTGRRAAYQSPKKGQLLRTPAVSPDGRYVIFQVFRDGGWLLDLTDGSMSRVLDDPSAEEFAWSPDGRRVAFHSRRSGEWGLWVMGR